MVSAIEAAELALQVPGVCVLPAWALPVGARPDQPGLVVPVVTGYLVWGAEQPRQRRWERVTDSFAAMLAERPVAGWQATAGERGLVSEVSVIAAGFIEQEAEQAWHALAEAVRKAVW